MKPPYLKEIDLSKGNKHEHPDLKTDGTNYLMKYRGIYLVGSFHRVWFGLTTSCGGLSPQFDAPGYNSSSWEAIWEIIDDEQEIRKYKIKNIENEEISENK